MDKQAKQALIAPYKAQPQHLTGTESKPVSPADGRKFTREELYKLLDCRTIEVVFMPGSGLIIIIDGEGKLKQRPSNAPATVLWNELVPGAASYDYIAGPCVVCPTAMLR